MPSFNSISCLWLGLQGCTALLLTFLSREDLSSSAIYLLRGYSALTLALAISIPIYTRTKTSDSRESPTTTNQNTSRANILLTVYHATTAWYTYTQTIQNLYQKQTDSHQVEKYLNAALCLGGSLLFSWGVLVLVFAGEEDRFSRSTGADKRTANFPFANKTSARAQKKEFRRKV